MEVNKTEYVSVYLRIIKTKNNNVLYCYSTKFQEADHKDVEQKSINDLLKI